MCINLEVLTGQYILHFYEWTGIEWQQILIFSLMLVTYRLMVRCWFPLHVFYGRSNLHSNNVVSSISANDIGFRFKRSILNCYRLVLFCHVITDNSCSYPTITYCTRFSFVYRFAKTYPTLHSHLCVWNKRFPSICLKGLVFLHKISLLL